MLDFDAGNIEIDRAELIERREIIFKRFISVERLLDCS